MPMIKGEYYSNVVKKNKKPRPKKYPTPKRVVTRVRVNTTVLRTLCQERGFTPTELARKIGVSPSTVNNWMWGKTLPQLGKFEKLCDALQVAPSFLTINVDDLVERGRTSRVIRFFVKEMLGENAAPDYREIQSVLEDVLSSAERIASEEETKEGELTVYSSGKSSGSSESDFTEGDGKSGEGDNGKRDSGVGEESSDASETVSASLSDS